MKLFHTIIPALALAALTLAACSKKDPAQQVRAKALPKAEQQAAAQGGVAIVDIDTLASQYEYCKAGQKQLEAKEKAYRQQLNTKGQALQNALADFQQKLQNGSYTSQQQAEQAQAALQKQQQALQTYQDKAEADMNKATADYQQVLRDSLNSFIKDYNADGRFSVILSKSGDNVLYASPAVDITADVVAGLNQRYNKSKK